MGGPHTEFQCAAGRNSGVRELRRDEALEKRSVRVHLLGFVTRQPMELLRVLLLYALDAPIHDLSGQPTEVTPPHAEERRDFRRMRLATLGGDTDAIRAELDQETSTADGVRKRA